MQFKDFLQSIVQNTLPDHSQIVLYGKECPVFFLSKLFLEIKKIRPFGSIDVEAYSMSDVKAQLSMSFLGSCMMYGIKNNHLLDAASKKVWNTFIKEYRGPHSVLFFSNGAPVEGEGVLSIELPEKIESTLYRILFTFFYKEEPDLYFLEKLFYQSDSLSVDESCFMMDYQMVVGRKCDPFFKHWLSRLIIPQKSFFALSQHLFAQQPTLFLEQWKVCKSDLPDEFWIAYWSEQLWQAALFVLRARNKGIVEAKKGAYRLPFSFINKDWQRYSSQMLTQAHSGLAQLDYALKNGGGSPGIELWYHRFFTYGL